MLENKKRYWLIFALAIAFYCYEFFLRLAPGVALPNIASYFSLNASGVSQLIAVYYFAYLVMQLPAGWLLDYFSPKPVLIISALVSALGVAIFVYKPVLWMGILGLIIAGAGSAFSFIGVLKLARLYLSKSVFTTLAGVAISLGTLAASYAAVAGAFFISHTDSWQSMFNIAAAFSLVVALSMYFGLPKFRLTQKKKFDWPAHINALKQLLGHWRLWVNGLMGGLFYMPTAVFTKVWGITYLSQHFVLTRATAALLVNLLFWGWVVGSPIVGWMADHLRSEKLLLTIMALLAAVVSIILFYGSEHNLDFLMLLAFLFGLFSSGQVIVWRGFNRLSGDTLAGTGIALTNMIITGVITVGLIFVGRLLEMHVVPGQLANYHLGFVSMPIAFVLAAVLVWIT